MLNPDELAKESPPAANELIRAGREMRRRIDGLIRRRTPFAVETTLAGANHFRTIKQCREAGYAIILYFVFVGRLELAKARVRLRVRTGGHDVPETDQDRRYSRSLENSLVAAGLADFAYFYDNSSQFGHRLVATFAAGKPTRIAADAPDWLRKRTAL